MRRTIFVFCFGVLCASLAGTSLPFSVVVPTPALAQSTEITGLQKQITDRNGRLKEIEAEIVQFQTDLKKVGAEKNTLQKAIGQLELERKKISSDIARTQNKIGTTDLEISKLSMEVGTMESSITTNKKAIGGVLRKVNESDEESLFLVLLRKENLSQFWGSVEELQDVKNALQVQVHELVSLKTLLVQNRDDEQIKRSGLVVLKSQYSDQNSVLANNKVEKDQLLKQTKNKEAAYQSLLKEKQQAKDIIEKEMRDFESKLKFILDPNTVPTPGTAVFTFPVKNFVVTQLFGGTEFAKRNASVYGGRAYHPGVDLAVPRGTQILAPLTGRVRAVGNTDAVPGCYSWGKWTLIDHPNGLATLYAHQDVISVVPGQEVKTGEVIGYSGNTGYSTGPHLHFTVYAKGGVSVRQFNEIKTITSCGSASAPFAAVDAYLDPMLYLPTP